MAEDWLQSGSSADIYPPPPNGDDMVNLQDFGSMALNWLIDCIADPCNPACVPK